MATYIATTKVFKLKPAMSINQKENFNKLTNLGSKLNKMMCITKVGKVKTNTEIA